MEDYSKVSLEDLEKYLLNYAEYGEDTDTLLSLKVWKHEKSLANTIKFSYLMQWVTGIFCIGVVTFFCFQPGENLYIKLICTILIGLFWYPWNRIISEENKKFSNYVESRKKFWKEVGVKVDERIKELHGRDSTQT